MATGLLLVVQGSGAVPPPMPQTGADCERPTYASDWVVCGDAALLALDRQVREAWRAIVARQPATQTAADLPPLLEAQEAWFGRRSRCAFVEAHAACLQVAYRDRARVLDAWQRTVSGTLTGPGTRMRCTGAPWGDATVIAHRPTAEALVVSGTDGQTLAIATPGGVSDGWRPFVQLKAAAPSIRLRPLTGAVITCNPA
ncbi:MAG: hypothetical protein MUF16_28605 [Burkholderiaceae bacterium]|nr:hypothetical protein [Burkholderiaceae bacterium]